MTYFQADTSTISTRSEYGVDKFFNEVEAQDLTSQLKSNTGKYLARWWDSDARHGEVVQFRDRARSSHYNGVVAIGTLGQTIYGDLGNAFGALYNPELQFKAFRLTRLIKSELHRTLSLGFDPSERMRAFAEGLHNENNLRESLVEHILSWPTLDADAVHQRLLADAEPFRLRSELIGLPVGGEFVYPEFQFCSDTNCLREAVGEVNMELGAVDDPWGAADWWFSENEWLEALPVDLLERRNGYSKLIAAVRAATEEV